MFLAFRIFNFLLITLSLFVARNKGETLFFTFFNFSPNFIKIQFKSHKMHIQWFPRMASGARISLTSPDPSSNNAQPDTKHENTFYSETDTVTFNAQAHEHKLTEFHDASSVSITSNLIESFETDDVVDDIDESVTESSLNDKQNVKVTIDSVDPYASDEQDKHSLNAIDNDDESEIPIIYKNDEL